MSEKRRRTKSGLVKLARLLRRNQTEQEKWLWRVLRARQFYGIKFRRQHPVGRYIVDFYCPERNLIIELDGDSHVEQAGYDRERTSWLEAQGFRVIRFTNREVTANLPGVLAEILNECGMDNNSLSPFGGEG